MSPGRADKPRRSSLAVRADPPAALAVPPAHLELGWRSLVPGDAEALVALVERMTLVDGYSTVDQRAVPPVGDGQDPGTDTLGGFDEDGELRAFGSTRVDAEDARTLCVTLTGGIDPRWRGRGIGRALLAWTEGRGRQVLADAGSDLPARLAVRIDAEARDARRLYAAGGFSPIRWYTTLQRDLNDPVPAQAPPEEVDVVPWSPELDDRVRAAHNEVVADRRGTGPHGSEQWLRRGVIVPAWSRVAIGRRDREVAGYVLSRRSDSTVVAHTDAIGVRRSWRGHGLAAVLLTQVLAAYRADGARTATLEVDADNPSGTHDWYRRLGYVPVRSEILYSVEI